MNIYFHQVISDVNLIDRDHFEQKFTLIPDINFMVHFFMYDEKIF